jgi:transposase
MPNTLYFVEKVRDIVGLYLSPPINALVLRVDEKSQYQALERTQPMLPLGLGYLEGVTHDCVRHGSATLFAALNTAKGEVIAQCKPSQQHQELLTLLRHVDQAVAAELDVHLIVDNYATHKHPKVRAWLARHTRHHMHFTPTYSSWLNQVERWFSLIIQQAICRGSFKNARQLIASIERYIEQYNQHGRPFVWTASANSILQKVARLCNAISGTEHEYNYERGNQEPYVLSRRLCTVSSVRRSLLPIVCSLLFVRTLLTHPPFRSRAEQYTR